MAKVSGNSTPSWRTSGAYTPQAGHWKSPYSISTVLASGLPRTWSVAEIPGAVSGVAEIGAPPPEVIANTTKPITITSPSQIPQLFLKFIDLYYTSTVEN